LVFFTVVFFATGAFAKLPAFDYQEETKRRGVLDKGISPEIPFIVEKVFDDLEPFIADDAK